MQYMDPAIFKTPISLESWISTQSPSLFRCAFLALSAVLLLFQGHV